MPFIQHSQISGEFASTYVLKLNAVFKCLLPEMFVIMFDVFLIFAFGRCYNCAPCLEFDYYWGDPGRFLKHFAHSVSQKSKGFHL